MDPVPQKICTKCRRSLPATTIYFAPAPRYRYGVMAQCRDCRKAYNRRPDVRARLTEYERQWYRRNKKRAQRSLQKYRQRHRAEIAERTKAYRAAHPEMVKEINSRYRQRHPDRGRLSAAHYRRSAHGKATIRRYKVRNRERIAASNRVSRLRRDYGITVEEFDCLLDAQHGACAICGAIPMRLVVDHDHATGRVRGLLCRKCNAAIGQLQDDSSLVTKALAYLRR